MWKHKNVHKDWGLKFYQCILNCIELCVYYTIVATEWKKTFIVKNIRIIYLKIIKTKQRKDFPSLQIEIRVVLSWAKQKESIHRVVNNYLHEKATTSNHVLCIKIQFKYIMQRKLKSYGIPTNIYHAITLCITLGKRNSIWESELKDIS